MPSTGRYHVLLLASKDLLDKNGVSQSAISSSVEMMQRFPPGVINLLILHSLSDRFEWTQLPPGAKALAEMRTYGLAKEEDAYDVLGVSKDEGSIVVVRPDGYVGMLAPLLGCESVEKYFCSCMIAM